MLQNESSGLVYWKVDFNFGITLVKSEAVILRWHATLLKKETLAHVFSCELCEIVKNTFFTEQLPTNASEKWVNNSAIHLAFNFARVDQIGKVKEKIGEGKQKKSKKLTFPKSSVYLTKT